MQLLKPNFRKWTICDAFLDSQTIKILGKERPLTESCKSSGNVTNRWRLICVRKLGQSRSKPRKRRPGARRRSNNVQLSRLRKLQRKQRSKGSRCAAGFACTGWLHVHACPASNICFTLTNLHLVSSIVQMLLRQHIINAWFLAEKVAVESSCCQT